MPDHQSSILASVTKRFKSSLVHHRLAYHVLPVRVYVSSLQRAANCTPPAPYVKLQYLNQLKLVFMWVLYTGRAGNIWSVSFSTRGRKTGEAGNPRSKARTNSKLSHINSHWAGIEPGHIGGRLALSQLRHPCFPNQLMWLVTSSQAHVPVPNQAAKHSASACPRPPLYPLLTFF